MSEKFQPTPEFYSTSPRGVAIREACAPTLTIVKRYLFDPTLMENFSERQRLLTQMELANGALIELGIVPAMHVGKTIKDFRQDATMTAEYLAGQLLPLLGDTLYPESDVAPIAQETNLLNSAIDTTPMIDLSDAPSIVIDFLRNTSILTFIEKGFAIDLSE